MLRFLCCFFFKQKTAYEMRISDWSSDVCSSDLPHPALKAAVPESPMVDGWMGDDWFHYGAFRLANIGWIGGQTGYKGPRKAPPSGGYDDYDHFRAIASAGAWAETSGSDRLHLWQRPHAPAPHDECFQGQAPAVGTAAHPHHVPPISETKGRDTPHM